MTPMDHFQNFIDGFGESIMLDTNSSYVSPRNGGYRRDNRNISGDWVVISRGMKKSVEKYGQSSN